MRPTVSRVQLAFAHVPIGAGAVAIEVKRFQEEQPFRHGRMIAESQQFEPAHLWMDIFRDYGPRRFAT